MHHLVELEIALTISIDVHAMRKIVQMVLSYHAELARVGVELGARAPRVNGYLIQA
jgi:hypothetical protein